VGKQVELLVSC